MRSAILPMALAALAMNGCTTRLPSSGVEPASVSRYAAIAVAPFVSDDVRVQYQSGFDVQTNPRVATGWDTRAKAGKIAVELLETSRTRVTPVDVTGLPPADNNTQDWAHQVWERLRAENRLGDADVLFIIRQNAIDVRGEQYSPALDFLAFGVVGLVAGAAGKSERYQPGFQLLTTVGIDAALGERSRCSIGLDARLLDARSGGEVARVDAVLGQEHLPDSFLARDWASMNDDERRVAETYCIAALRRAVSQAASTVILTAK